MTATVRIVPRTVVEPGSTDLHLADALAWAEAAPEQRGLSNALAGFVAGRRTCPCRYEEEADHE